MHRISVGFIALLMLLIPAAAEAADTVVIRQGDVELTAADRDEGDLCLGLRVAGKKENGMCAAPDGDPFGHYAFVTTVGERGFVAGMVNPGPHALDLEFPNGSGVRRDIVRSEAYAGRFAEKVAFFLAEVAVPAGTRLDGPVLVRFYDAAGTLVHASGSGDPRRQSKLVTVLRHRAGRARALLRAAAFRRFAPTRARLDRVERAVCLTYDIVGGASSHFTCASAGGPVAPLSLKVVNACGPLGILVGGFTAPAVRRVELRLGSGRRLRARTLASVGGTHRPVAFAVPRSEAVRSSVALDRRGRALARKELGEHPATRRCGFDHMGTDGDDFEATYGPFRPAPPEGQQVAIGAAPGPRLVVRDLGDLVCVGVDRLAADGRDCQDGGLWALLMHGPTVHATDAYTGAGGVVPEDAAAMRVEFDGREKVAATIGEGGDYTGIYRGRVRFFLAQAPGRRKVTGVEALDAQGRLIHTTYGPEAAPVTIRQRGGARGYRLVGFRYMHEFDLGEGDEDPERGVCLTAIRPGEDPGPSCGDGTIAFARVLCSPRIGVVAGRLTKGLRGVRLELAGGGTLTSRTVRIPRSLGGGRLWLVELPAGAEVRRLRFVGRPPKEPGYRRPPAVGAYPVPAPKRQCGYDLAHPAFLAEMED